jgi:hypothetical protein
MEDLMAYLKRARGGRVVQTGFLPPEAQAELLDLAGREGLNVAFFGGFPLAERKVGVLYPPEVPSVHDPVQVFFLEKEPPDLGEAMGDVEPLEEGFLVALLPKGKRALEEAGFTLLPPPEGALRPSTSGCAPWWCPPCGWTPWGPRGSGFPAATSPRGSRRGRCA